MQSDALTVTLTELRQDGDSLPLPEMALSLSGLAARLSRASGGDTHDLTATADSLTTTFAFDDPQSGDSIGASSALSGLDLAAQFDAEGSDAAGWTGALALSAGPARAFTRQSGPEIGSIETDIGTDSAQLELAVAPETVAYAAELRDTALTVRSDRLPVGEVQLGIGSTGFALTAPRPEDLDRPQGGTARVELHLSDVIAGEPLWALFDPGRALPRTAAHLDLGGRGRPDTGRSGHAASVHRRRRGRAAALVAKGAADQRLLAALRRGRDRGRWQLFHRNRGRDRPAGRDPPGRRAGPDGNRRNSRCFNGCWRAGW